MSRESDWLAAQAYDAFPGAAEFVEGQDPSHVIVKWSIASAHGHRRNAPLAVAIDPKVVDRWYEAGDREQARISRYVRSAIRNRMRAYHADGPVDVPAAFLVTIDEGAL
ncbi:hypothetical protein [Pandoraea sp.]|uniref:hypothetical protein n=1 Tax=Pandoraea sp. TaxID=1883445 RepID=UPI0011FBFED8|nr:hypothetical protein [Pandoraea sp.]TAL53191.1 MAG: hypothetical protein EPN80_16435 [Pandoraea sp.]TAM20601.1 MAG: hypothetical protein EPN65_00300 [Pandoraea sp.]